MAGRRLCYDYKNSNQYENAKKIWDDFCDVIKHQKRFMILQTPEGSKLVQCLDKIIEIPSEYYKKKHNVTNLYRARKGDFKTGLSKERITKEFQKPNTNVASVGRGNPLGISYLYVSSDIDTAISEIKPSIGDYVTVATICILDSKDKKIFSFESLEKWFKQFNIVKEEDELNRCLMYIINEEMTRKIDHNIDYIPLQFVMEYIKDKCFWAFEFDSSRNSGYNYVVFHNATIEVIKTELFIINDYVCKYEKEKLL